MLNNELNVKFKNQFIIFRFLLLKKKTFQDHYINIIKKLRIYYKTVLMQHYFCYYYFILQEQCLFYIYKFYILKKLLTFIDPDTSVKIINKNTKMYILYFNLICSSYDCLHNMIFDFRLSGIIDFTFYNVNYNIFIKFQIGNVYLIKIKFYKYNGYFKTKTYIKIVCDMILTICVTLIVLFTVFLLIMLFINKTQIKSKLYIITKKI